jgi:hypothetical protein
LAIYEIAKGVRIMSAKTINIKSFLFWIFFKTPVLKSDKVIRPTESKLQVYEEKVDDVHGNVTESINRESVISQIQVVPNKKYDEEKDVDNMYHNRTRSLHISGTEKLQDSDQNNMNSEDIQQTESKSKQPSPIFCIMCGQESASRDRFCFKCGNKLI